MQTRSASGLSPEAPAWTLHKVAWILFVQMICTGQRPLHEVNFAIYVPPNKGPITAVQGMQMTQEISLYGG